VIVGKEGWMVDPLVRRLRSHPMRDERVFWLGGVDDSQLAWLYAHAFVAVAPSIYEGLGVPVMEALGYGSPTLASSGGALTEAGGDHVEPIDPDDTDALVVAIERHLLDATHHGCLADAAARYVTPRWSQSAEVLAEALLQLTYHHPPRVDRRSGHPGG